MELATELLGLEIYKNILKLIRRTVFPSWLVLRSYGSMRLVRSSYFWFAIVPVCAKLLERVNDVVHFLVFGANIPVAFELPFSWKLFFFSSLFFAIGTTIYNWQCPGIIKNYATFEEFSTRDGQSQIIIKNALADYANELKQPIVFTTQFVKQFTLQGGENKSYGPTKLVTETSIRSDVVSDSFFWTRDQVATSRKTWRAVCAMFYWIGFILFLWVSGNVIIYVGKLLFKPLLITQY